MELCQNRMRWWQQSKLEQFKCVALREEKRTLAIPKVERRCIGLENYKNKRGAAVKPASSLYTAASSASRPVLEQSLKHSWSSCSAEDLLMEEPTMEKKVEAFALDCRSYNRALGPELCPDVVCIQNSSPFR